MQKMNAILLSFSIFFIGILVLLLCIFALPQLANETATIHPEVAYLKLPILLGLYATAIPFFYALYETVKLIQIAMRESVFTIEILLGFNRIKICAITIITLYVFGFIILTVTNALPPLVALIGILIMFITLMVAFGANFIRTVLKRHVAY